MYSFVQHFSLKMSGWNCFLAKRSCVLQNTGRKCSSSKMGGWNRFLAKRLCVLQNMGACGAVWHDARGSAVRYSTPWCRASSYCTTNSPGLNWFTEVLDGAALSSQSRSFRASRLVADLGLRRRATEIWKNENYTFEKYSMLEKEMPLRETFHLRSSIKILKAQKSRTSEFCRAYRSYFDSYVSAVWKKRTFSNTLTLLKSYKHFIPTSTSGTSSTSRPRSTGPTKLWAARPFAPMKINCPVSWRGSSLRSWRRKASWLLAW